jgi:hypothetical protein
MRKLLFILLSGVFSIIFFGLNPQVLKAQENPFDRLKIISALQTPPRSIDKTRSSQIKKIQVLAKNFGIAYTEDTIFRTNDNGQTWSEINLPRRDSQKIAYLYFQDERISWKPAGGRRGWAVLIDDKNFNIELAETLNGGESWNTRPADIPSEVLLEANLSNIYMGFEVGREELSLYIPLQTSSNFIGEIIYQSEDAGESWKLRYKGSTPRNDESELESEFSSGDWVLKSAGNCAGFKVGCVQTQKIYFQGTEITPPPIKELARQEKEQAKLQAENSVFAQPPGGTTRISLNRGFDKCTAGTVAQMQTWWNNSPFYDVNIYMSGRNRACSQAQLTAAWVNSVTAQGWGLIPTVVGYQSPCTASTTSAKFSSDPAVAEQQGRGEADIAIADANNLGLTQGTVLYYDMERYDDLSGTGACSTPTKAFLKGWTDRLKELGYISGVYGSPFNANGDWINMPPASQPDVVWLARWNNVMSVWGVAPLPDTFWTNHQRIHQWLGPRNETWGGVTFNIDNNISDAPVAGLAIAKNKRADFDGDGKTDISVFRPSNGVWYVTNSSNSTYSILNFGLSTDVLVPGDYDGDGKTDFAVWRPDTGVWHLFSRSIYLSFAFGAAGDIPVPADYDGDGKADAAVFRPSTGTWYIWNSFDSRGTSYTIVQFGLNGDKPVVGDYDGDGRADIAIYRPSNGEWWLNRSTAGVVAATFGVSTDKPVAADFSGDGKTDIAFWRESTGEWFILRSEDASYYSVPFGQSGDIPAVGDFDGDGRDDAAVFRPSTGVWYISQSQAGILITQFGMAADSPVPAAYAP